MLITLNRLKNAPILSLQTGAPLGQITEPIVDPRQLNIVAFHCTGARIQGPAILHTTDIRELSNMGLIVDSADSLMSPDGLVRLKEVLNLNFQLLGKVVIDTRRHRLGRVEDYSIDIDNFYIQKLNVRQPLFKSFLGGNLLIDRSQIVEINDRRIIVQSTEVKTKETARKSTPLLENPFRHHETPQPDTIRTNSEHR